jgi:hypothetical protein
MLSLRAIHSGAPASAAADATLRDLVTGAAPKLNDEKLPT